MANTSKKKKTEKTEVIANCDNISINIESLIHTIRGQKVMVDFDLAMLYGVQTKALNQAVKRNTKRFPDDFMFQLTQEEWNILRSQIVTAKTPEDHVTKCLTLCERVLWSRFSPSSVSLVPLQLQSASVG